VFFDVDEVSTDLTVGGQHMPHMLPNGHQFALSLASLGLYEGHHIVVYDNSTWFTASSRFWWTCKALGSSSKVSILDGGLKAWKKAGLPVHGLGDRRPSLQAVDEKQTLWYTKASPRWVRSMPQMIDNVRSRKEQVVDARPAGRYAGKDPEPRSVKRNGHIPGAVSVPHSEMFADGFLKPLPELRRILFTEHKLDPQKPVACYCGSGITASTVALALTQCGVRDVAVYDGSWTEWGNAEQTGAPGLVERDG